MSFVRSSHVLCQQLPAARLATLDRLLEVSATVLPAETIEALRAKGEPVKVALAMAAAGR